MLSTSTVQIIKATTPALKAHGPAITDRMYSLLFKHHPELKNVFNMSHQATGMQARSLADAIYQYALHVENPEALTPLVERVAQKHVGLEIRPEQYPVVGKYLLQAIEDVLGDAATDEVIEAWGEAYQFLANVFINREKKIYHDGATQKGGWEGFRNFVISRKVKESSMVTSFYLTPEDGKAIAGFKPGQYITFKLKIPGLDHTVLRNYSLSDAADKDYYRVSIKREPGAIDPEEFPMGVASNYFHDHLQEGSVVPVHIPTGNFFLNTETSLPVVLISGGVGQTPLMSMLNTLVTEGANRPVWYIHGTRNGKEHAFKEHIKSLEKQHGHIHTYICYERPGPKDVLGKDYDAKGLISLDLIQQLLPGKEADFYFCGPKAFMKNLYHSLTAWGVPEKRIHFEFFGPSAEITE
ncbi:NO-inducible flavohemoprotein [Catalinimonas niigatensis]|uniref:NO-inducible flavohemoprotein n=1 Tax=Catalinimonas niigatensis TaxID=1397264 RepID=UPI002666ED12|nr:NO-inducible flavohemoprotein [Catalinimonas niigatensis]WPP47995.1 NO-inducible flavohemoprotein [Catalinimonas niigatensis]